MNSISQKSSRVTTTKSFFALFIIMALILSIPLVAMQFTEQVNWNLMDFLIVGFLIFAAGSIFILISRKLGSTILKWLAGIVILGLLLLTWAHLAVDLW
ncbi:MAG: hypothetical protein HWD86_05720 [Kangiellaceae bacterium]|nr:hypothetical protein [Kangiellaceae bacterium]